MNEKKYADSFLKKSTYIINILFLLCHVVYLILFLIFKSRILVFVNVGSIFIYVLFFTLIKYRLYTLYTFLSLLEIAIFIAISNIVVGERAGFQEIIIALVVFTFYQAYFLRLDNFKINAIPIVILLTLEYVFLYFYDEFTNPIDDISAVGLRFLFTVHIMIVFLFIIAFLIVLLIIVFKLEKNIKLESRTDKLTEIPNRLALNDYFDSLHDDKSKYVLAIFDIDNFKKFNDVNGHLCGDYVLKEIAKIAKENSLDDFVSRWGGEEFVLISKMLDSEEDTINKIDQIRIKICDYQFKYNNKNLHSTITIGVSHYKDEISLDEWIKLADKKLYKGKNNGKNQTVI